MAASTCARVLRLALASASIAALGAALPAAAQSTAGTDTPVDAPAAEHLDGPQLEEIIVTARKREESLQNVPIAVTAFGGTALREAQITDLSALAGRTPSFTFQAQGSLEQEAFIRGVGTVRLTSASADPSIGLFINEVYIGRRGSATPPIFDVERVEVLRGPQGTIFGKNVVGGAISLITGAPRFDRQTPEKPSRDTTGIGRVKSWFIIKMTVHLNEPHGRKLKRRQLTFENTARVEIHSVG